MSNSMSLLIRVLLLSVTCSANAARGREYTPAEKELLDQIEAIERNYLTLPQNLFSAVTAPHTGMLERLLKQECADVYCIFPEAKAAIQSLVRDADRNECSLITSALSPSMPPELINLVTQYTGSRLGRYKLLEIVTPKNGFACRAKRLGALLLKRNLPAKEPDEQVLYFRVESEKPRSSSTVKNSDGATLLELAKAQEEAKDDESGGASMAPYRTCMELLEQQPAALMRAYVAHCRQEAQACNDLGS